MNSLIPEAESITHKQLVEAGAVYLKTAQGCNPVFMERGSARTIERPDIVGWTDECIVVECKTSRSDLAKDMHKPFRVDPKLGMGDRRFYLLPKGLYDDMVMDGTASKFIPDSYGILLAEPFGSIVHVYKLRLRHSCLFESNVKAERDYLRSRILEVQRFGR